MGLRLLSLGCGSVSFGILKEPTTFILKRQIAQEDFLLIRFTPENEYSSFFQMSKNLTQGSSFESQQTGTLICTATATETSKLLSVITFRDAIVFIALLIKEPKHNAF